MKKNRILLLSLIALPLLASCSGETIIKPRRSYPGDPIEEKEAFEETNMTVNFYLDFSHSEEVKDETYPVSSAKDYGPIYTMKWYMLKPLEKCPQEALDAIAAAREAGMIDPLSALGFMVCMERF